MLIGLTVGFALDFCLCKCRRFQNRLARTFASLFLVVVFTFAAICAFADGMFFISAVWDDPDDISSTEWDIHAAIAAAVVLPVVHMSTWLLGKLAEKNLSEDGTSGNGDASQSKRAKRQHVATSMIWHGISESANVKEESTAKPQNVQEGDDDVNVVVAEDVDGDVHQEEEEEAEEPPPTLWKLMMKWKLCGCVRGDDTTTSQKIFKAVNWFLCLLACAICLFFVISNIGSTHQQKHAREKLPAVHDILHKSMDEGPVCAFDNRGADSNMTTFPDKDAAHDAGFLVLHCGVCGACSDWHNLELECTTR